jgi:hypothetical protein
MATLRNTLFSMTQAEESEWRMPFLRMFSAENTPSVESHDNSPNRIPFFGHQVCLKGFANIAGGPNYIRSCYRDMSRIADVGYMIDTGSLPRSDRGASNVLLRRESHQRMALEAYLRGVVEQLAENDPVSGKRIITVSAPTTTSRHAQFVSCAEHMFTSSWSITRTLI